MRRSSVPRDVEVMPNARHGWFLPSLKKLKFFHDTLDALG